MEPCNLILREEKEGIWTDHTYRGAKIRLKIRPADTDMTDALLVKHTTYNHVKDPDNPRQMLKVTEVNGKALFEDMADYYLEDFQGIGYGKNRPLEVNKKNKLIVANLSPLNNEESIWEFVKKTANELRTLSDEEAEKQIKNS